MPPINLAALCEQAVLLTSNVGAFLQAEFGRVETIQIQTKARNHLVSHVDQTAERRLIDGLALLLPEAAFLAEEGTVAHETRDWQWIIDPLDGTTNFLHGLPFFSISIALQYQEETVLGIVHEAVRGESFYSWKGAPGTYCNQQLVQTSPTTELADSLLATGFPYYDFEQQAAYLAVLGPLMQATRGLRRFGSAALDLAYVACGRFEGYFEYSLSPWDVAAGAFLVQQAGGTVTDFSGGNHYLHGREIVAGNVAIHGALLELLQRHFGSTAAPPSNETTA